MVTFDGFDELDSCIAAALVNRCRRKGLEAFSTTPAPVATSMNGVEATGQRPPEFVAAAAALRRAPEPARASESGWVSDPGRPQIQVSSHILDCQPL